MECRGTFHRFEFHSYSQSIGPRSWNPQMRAADTGIEQCCRPVKREGVAEHPKEPALTPSREIPPLSSKPIESGQRTGAESIQRRHTDSQQASVDALNHQTLEIWKPRPQRSISSHPAGRPQWGLGRWTSSSECSLLLVEDLNWVPRTHIWLFTPASTLYLQGIRSPHQAPVCIFTDTYMEIKIHLYF